MPLLALLRPLARCLPPIRVLHAFFLPAALRPTALLPACLLPVCLLFASAPAHAQDFPVRPVRLITPYAAGGGIDLLARAVAQGLSQVWNQQVIVDNRPGAGSTIGNAAVAKAAPDGYTLLVSANAMAIGPVAYRTLPYDLKRDFAAISLVASTPEVLTVAPGLGVGQVSDLIARARGRTMNYGSAGKGTLAHLAAESFNRRAQLASVHVPYKGSNPALIDLISGQIDWLFDSPAALIQHIQSGKLRALAVASARRTAQLPEVPTLAEAGFPGLEFLIWMGLMAPASTPQPVLDHIERTLAEVLRGPATRKSLGDQGWDIAEQGSKHFASFFEREIERLGEAARNAGMSPE